MQQIVIRSNAQKVWLKTLGLENDWSERFIIFEDGGKLSLFKDEAMHHFAISFDLSLWSNGKINVFTKETGLTPFRMSLETEEGTVWLAFESEANRRVMAKSIKQFMGREDGDLLQRREPKSLHGMLSEFL